MKFGDSATTMFWHRLLSELIYTAFYIPSSDVCQHRNLMRYLKVVTKLTTARAEKLESFTRKLVQYVRKFNSIAKKLTVRRSALMTQSETLIDCRRRLSTSKDVMWTSAYQKNGMRLTCCRRRSSLAAKDGITNGGMRSRGVKLCIFSFTSGTTRKYPLWKYEAPYSRRY